MVDRHSSSQCAVSSTRKGAAKRSRFSLFIFKSRTRLLQEQERRAKLETIKAELLATGEVHSANFYIKTPRGWRIVSVLQEISQNIGLFSEIRRPTSFSVHYAANIMILIGGGKFSSFVPLLNVRIVIAKRCLEYIHTPHKEDICGGKRPQHPWKWVDFEEGQILQAPETTTRIRRLCERKCCSRSERYF